MEEKWLMETKVEKRWRGVMDDCGTADGRERERDEEEGRRQVGEEGGDKETG